jgi:membrane-associated phospholipid phosphatase
MSRGLGVFDTVDALVPDALAILVALATQLGDIWFVAALLVGLYWYTDGAIADRESLAAVLGLTVGALALAYALKHTFALPRPTTRLVQLQQLPAILRPLYAATGTATGYGFPSGHAIISTVVYGLLAQRLSIWTPRRRYAVAAALVTLVCTTRVVLGVHFVVDVVAGVAVGTAYVAATGVALARVDDEATAAFGIAVALGALALAVVGLSAESVLLVGTSATGLAWQFGRRRPSGPSPTA